MKTFHHSNLDSPRLQKLMAVLRERGKSGATTLDLAACCYSTRPSSDVSELRANNVPIKTTFEGTNENGRKVYRYALVATPDEAHAAFDAAYAKFNPETPEA